MAWTLTQLRTFCVVADVGSMHAAAVQLGYTPGAVSQQMSGLTRVVGQELFLRSGRGVVLSDAGQRFLPHARRVVERDEEARRALSDVHAGRPTVRVGIFETAGAVACRPLLRRTSQAEPPVDVVFEEVDVEHGIEAVRSGAVDLALSVHYSLVPVPLPPGVQSTVLLTEPFVQAHAVDEVAGAPWIVPPVTETFGMAVQAALRRAEQVQEGAHVVTDTALMVALAEAGVGRALVTPLMLRVHPRDVVVTEAPRAGSRSVVALTTGAQAERASVQSVLANLQDIFRQVDQGAGRIALG